MLCISSELGIPNSVAGPIPNGPPSELAANVMLSPCAYAYASVGCMFAAIASTAFCGPLGKEAAFFGLYEVSERGTSWMGPLLFSIVIARTGSYRQALLSLVFFFVVGLVLLWITNTDKGIKEANAV